MKLNNKIFYNFLVLLMLTTFAHKTLSAQTDKKYSIKKFQVWVINSDYAMAYSVLIYLTEKQLKIIYKGELEGEKDTLLFSRNLQPSDTLQQISEINLDQLGKYYSNRCTQDGSQISVTLKIDNKTKSVHLSNYYHEEIGRIIYLINSLAPTKYKIWYDKAQLIEEYQRCKGIK